MVSKLEDTNLSFHLHEGNGTFDIMFLFFIFFLLMIFTATSIPVKSCLAPNLLHAYSSLLRIRPSQSSCLTCSGLFLLLTSSFLLLLHILRSFHQSSLFSSFDQKFSTIFFNIFQYLSIFFTSSILLYFSFILFFFVIASRRESIFFIILFNKSFFLSTIQPKNSDLMGTIFENI
jgi:hypothetical protein